MLGGEFSQFASDSESPYNVGIVIEYRDVSKIFPDGTQALADVNLAVEEQEFVFLVGPSGAGKTTLLKFLIREDLPSSGEVFLEDEDVVRLPANKVPRLRRRVGMVFQDFKLLRQKSAFENVAFALEVSGADDAEVNEVVPYLLEQVGLQERAKAFPDQLSAGEQQRVAIARALVHEPKVLLADEPTGNLDRQNAEQIVGLLQQINQWGTTVIMATHDEAIVGQLDKRIVELDKGAIINREQ